LRLGPLHRHGALGVERVVDEDVLEPPRPLPPLEAAGQPERRDPPGEICEARRVGRGFGDQGLSGVEADPRVQAADQSVRSVRTTFHRGFGLGIDKAEPRVEEVQLAPLGDQLPLQDGSAPMLGQLPGRLGN
jgi:hypothetical protein